MMRNRAWIVLLLASAVLPSSASALTIVGTAPAVSTNSGSIQSVLVEYSIPAGEIIVAATIEGTFGNSEIPNTAPLDLYFGGQFNSTTGELEGAILVATCSVGPCTSSPTPTAWSFTFAPDQFEALSPSPLIGGPVEGRHLSMVNHPGEVGKTIGVTTLTLTTVPEPSTALLLASGLLGLMMRQRQRS